MTDKRVEDMTGDVLMIHLHLWVDDTNGPFFDEVLARLAERDAMLAKIVVHDYDWLEVPASWIDGYNACGRDILAAASAARKEAQHG